MGEQQNNSSSETRVPGPEENPEVIENKATKVKTLEQELAKQKE